MAVEGNTAGVSATHIQGERHVSEVAGITNPQNKKMAMYGFCGVGALIAGLFFYQAITQTDTEAKPKEAAAMTLGGSRKPFEAAPPLPTTHAALEAPPTEIPPLPTDDNGLVGASPGAPIAAVASGPVKIPGTGRLVVYTGSFTNVAQSIRGSVPSAAPQGAEVEATESELAAQLRPSVDAKGVRATVLRNQPYMLTAGTIVPCTLQTAMDSTLAGFVTCIIPQDVVGKSGLTLLDRGTKVIGEFRGGASRAKPRLFVLWTRAETPQGVVIDLNSPAADPLGRSGVHGEIDNRFFDRFGAALLLSTVESGLEALVQSQTKEGSTTINTNQSQQVVNSILQDSVNLPPIIRKHQGELVSIFVRQDLDFSTVYGLNPVQRAQVAAVRK